MSKRALVVGGSIGGLFAGLLLKRIGWDVSICERTGAELGSRGAGIVTHDELLEILALASDDSSPIGVAVSGRVVLARDGSTVCEMKRPQVLASWDRIWQRLRLRAEGIYHHGRTLASFTSSPSHVLAHFTDGQSERVDLLIGADGIQSTVRQQLFPHVKPRYAGYIAWRGLVDGSDLAESTRRQLFDSFGFCLPQHEQMLGYPVDGPPTQNITTLRYNYVWYRPAHPDTELPDLLKGADDRQYVGAIPPDLLRTDVVAAMRDAAQRSLAPAFQDIVRQTRKPLLQPIVDLETPAMAAGRVVLTGDAAFVARPHVGAGVTKAAQDAKALADTLANSDDIDTALAAFNAQRHAIGSTIVRRARHLGSYMQSQLLSPEERATAEKHRNPNAVMTETASLHGFMSW